MDPVAFLMELVSIPSLSGREERVADYLVTCMRKLGFKAEKDAVGNAVGVLGDGPREIVLLGHMDTVEGGPKVELRDGILYGRGSVDAKGPLATFVQAVSRLQDVSGFRFVVIGAVEEEVPSSRGAHYVAATHRPEACLIGEPSGWDALTLGYKGFVHAEYRQSQPTAHTSGPDPSVAERAIDYWNRITALVTQHNEGKERIFEQLQATIRGFNTTFENDHDHACMRLGFRLPPALAPNDWTETLQQHCPQDAELSFLGTVPAWRSERSTPLVQAFNHAFRDAGVRPRHKHKTGTSDMNVVGPAWRCPIAAYGPGDSSLDHTPQEHVSIAEYTRAIDVLSFALNQYMAAARSKVELAQGEA